MLLFIDIACVPRAKQNRSAGMICDHQLKKNQFKKVVFLHHYYNIKDQISLNGFSMIPRESMTSLALTPGWLIKMEGEVISLLLVRVPFQTFLKVPLSKKLYPIDLINFL